MLYFNFKKQQKIIVVIGLLIFLHFIGVLRPAENLIIRLSQPVIAKTYNLGTFWRFNSDPKNEKNNLLTRNTELERQAVELTAINANLKNIEEENQKLREFLNFFTKNNNKYLVANVVAQENFLDANRSDQNIVIDKGRKDGLSFGYVVIDSAGAVVGKVVDVGDESSRICLLTNNTCKIAVSVLNQERTIGVAEGDMGLTVKINFVGQTEKINLNDIVATSGLEKDIPTGLVVGRVNQINNNENDVWQNIVIEPLANFDNLKIVSVLLPR
jgi:rod shape-determining protein MreC